MVDKPARFNCVALAIGAILAVWGAETIDERGSRLSDRPLPCRGRSSGWPTARITR